MSCAVLQERIKNVTTEKNRLSARCDNLVFKYQIVPVLAKEANGAHKLCVEFQHLKEECAKSAGPNRSV